MTKLASGTLTAASLALALLPATTQGQMVAGPVVAYHDEADLGVGAFLIIPIPSIHEDIAVKTDFGFFFPGDDLSYLEFNADALMRFPIPDNPDVEPFAFAGLGLARVSVHTEEDVEDDSTTDLGLNLGGGVAFTGVGSVRPAVGLKVELGGGEGFVIFGSLGFPIGGSGES
jgi:hypothetical protein